MFRKPSKKGSKVKENLRRRHPKRDDDDDDHGTLSAAAVASTSNAEDDDEDENEESTGALLAEARQSSSSENHKRRKLGSHSTTTTSSTGTKEVLLPSFDSGTDSISGADWATRSALHHPDASKDNSISTASKMASETAKDDGIYREHTKRNPFWAGPIKASTNIRTTARFDYQPDICKDYKDTGFCGFGDTCIYLHDRGDTATGWQLEQAWQEQQKAKQQQHEAQVQAFLEAHSTTAGDRGATSATNTSSMVTADGFPFACHLCRNAFQDPVVTNCQHYFCQACLLQHIQESSKTPTASNTAPCPICHKDTGGVFHQPTKLLAQKRKVLGLGQSKQPDSWQLFYDALSSSSDKRNDD